MRTELVSCCVAAICMILAMPAVAQASRLVPVTGTFHLLVLGR